MLLLYLYHITAETISLLQIESELYKYHVSYPEYMFLITRRLKSFNKSLSSNKANHRVVGKWRDYVRALVTQLDDQSMWVKTNRVKLQRSPMEITEFEPLLSRAADGASISAGTGQIINTAIVRINKIMNAKFNNNHHTLLSSTSKTTRQQQAASGATTQKKKSRSSQQQYNNNAADDEGDEISHKTNKQKLKRKNSSHNDQHQQSHTTTTTTEEQEVAASEIKMKKKKKKIANHTNHITTTGTNTEEDVIQEFAWF